MAGSKATGDAGEQYIVDTVQCPNCGKPLMKLPPSYPLFDVQCTGCVFRAQVKTSTSKPKAEIRGAGWDVIEKVLKVGYQTPPLIAHFTWDDGGTMRHKAVFYPFIPKRCLRMYQLKPTARRANYRMFNYVDLDTIPSMTLHEE
jgi:hypothetical protein